MTILFLSFLFGYVMGSIPFGLILTKFAGLGDIRNIGSGSIGATNVLRTGNKGLAFATLVLDGGKGALAIFLASYYIPDPCAWIDCEGPCFCLENTPFFDTEIYFSQIPFLVGLAAIIGHCFPVWLKFVGGKGVATAAAVLFIAVPVTGVITCCIWLTSAFITRISSLSALLAALSVPVSTFVFYGPLSSVIGTFITLLVFYKHRANIQRLLKGEEPKIGQKKT